MSTSTIQNSRFCGPSLVVVPWKKHAVPQDGVVYFRAKNYQPDEERFFNEYLWWLMAYYAKGEPLDTKGATELAERLAAPLGH